MRPGSRPRVLIADDHPGMLRSLQGLVAYDCDVVGTVTDGRALLEAAVRLQPDVVIADLNMPTISGLEACRELVRSNPAMKVILLSAMNDAQIAEHALESGASAFLVKYALVPDQLIETIRRICAQ
jgi:DNA-binding NarL/FixJ family response regulator